MKDEKRKEEEGSTRVGDLDDDGDSDVSLSDLESDSEDFDDNDDEEEEDRDEEFLNEERLLATTARRGSVQANSEAAAGAKRIQVFDKGIRQLIGENGAQHKELDLGIAMTQHLLVAADGRSWAPARDL